MLRLPLALGLCVTLASTTGARAAPAPNGGPDHDRTGAARRVVQAELTAIKEKAERYLKGESSLEEFRASTPMLSSIAGELGCLTADEVIAFRRAVTLDMEMRTAGNKEKARLAVEACDTALELLSSKEATELGSEAPGTLSPELTGVIVGGTIGVVGSLAATLILSFLSNRRRRRAIRAITKGEVTAVREKAQRYIEGHSSKEEVGASTPMLTSIVSEIGFLTEDQAVAFRRVVTLDMELRKQGTKEKAQMTVEACDQALRLLSRQASARLADNGS